MLTSKKINLLVSKQEPSFTTVHPVHEELVFNILAYRFLLL